MTARNLNGGAWIVFLLAGLLAGCQETPPTIQPTAASTPAPAQKDSWYWRTVPEGKITALRTKSESLGAVIGDIEQSQFNTESYDRINENKFRRVLDHPVSTFSIDVDTASYSNVRRFLKQGSLPPVDAVRIEELINYFRYNYPVPAGEHPFSVSVDCAASPWNKERALLRIGIKGKEVSQNLGAANFVFLVDVSGSMKSAGKLELVKESLIELVKTMSPNDNIAIVVYAGSAGLVLPSTSSANKQAIITAIERLEAGGSTHGSQGIEQAYEVAVANFVIGGVNRVILCTDGDFNVGVTSPGQLTRLIQAKGRSGVFLTVLGFGMGNYKDSTMEKLADLGNGNYAYIDNIDEARKVLIEEANSTFVAIAKDVKIQIEFNATQVAGYRLIGYENRLLQKEDFNDDTKDAGDIGAGHTVTALYEIIPAGSPVPGPEVEPLRYQSKPALTGAPELGVIKLRYKEPAGEASKLIAYTITDDVIPFERAMPEFKFAAAVAGFGMLLRQSEFVDGFNWEYVRALAAANLQEDSNGRRKEFLEMVDLAQQISGQVASRQ